MDICNYNDSPMTFKRAKDDTSSSTFLKFWYPDPEWTKIFIKKEKFCDIDGCTKKPSSLGINECLSAKSSAEIQTTRSNFFLKTRMQGPLDAKDEDGQNKFCYAYAYEPIELTYDYGDGPCNMSVSRK